MPSPPPAAPAGPGSLDAEQSAQVAKNPPGVTLTVGTVDGRRRFFVGEPIPIVLALTSTVQGTYDVDLRDYDRSGRLWSERFRFDPPVVDPLADYFDRRGGSLGGIGFMGGLTTTPATVKLVLNEWARFPKPGVYRVFVTSQRVSLARSRTLRELPVAAKNALEIEIVEGAAWQSRELARIAAVLATGGTHDERTATRRALRFLTTPAATQVKVDELCRAGASGDPGPWDVVAGLYGAPDRDVVLAALREGLERPDCAVSDSHLDLLARLDGKSSKTPGDDAQIERSREVAVRALVAALAKKSTAARGVSTLTALVEMSERESSADKQTGDELRRLVAQDLAGLSDPVTESVLDAHWQVVRSPAITPSLIRIVEAARPREGRFRSASDLALGRLLDIDYRAGRKLVLAELARGARTSFSGSTLGRLKDAELPALDEALAAGLRAPERDGESLELNAEVFARYASKAKLADAKRAYREVAYFRISLLGYVQKHDPAFVEAEIARFADFDSLQRLSKFMWSGALEAAIFRKLDGPDCPQAAGVLAERGSAAAEAILRAKRESLRGKPDAQRCAQALQSALVDGVSWSTPPARLRILSALCDDDDCRQTMQRHVEAWGSDGKSPRLSFHARGDTFRGSLGHYELRSLRSLERRIAQLPPGTKLVWEAAGVVPEVAATVRSWAAARKIEIVKE